MRRLAVLVAALGLVIVAIPVTADEEFEPHPHMLVQRPEFAIIDGALHLVGYRKCVDLANNHAVPLHAHHERLHFGTSGVSFGGQSGNVVAPTAPFPAPFFEPLPWANCAEFATVLPLEIPEE